MNAEHATSLVGITTRFNGGFDVDTVDDEAKEIGDDCALDSVEIESEEEEEEADDAPSGMSGTVSCI